MPKLSQTFANPTNAPIFLTLELSTSRYRLDPGGELMLHYDPSDRAADEYGSALRIEIIPDCPRLELAIYTAESALFHPDGREAEMNFDVA